MDVKRNWRPQNLAEVLERGLAANFPGSIDASLREFLDEFYTEQDSEKRTAMLLVEPPCTGKDTTDAYLAAVAEHLSRRYKLKAPEWTNEKSRFLKRAHFPCGLESLKAILLIESPIAFRRRMIFVGADPLYRPRRDKLGIG